MIVFILLISVVFMGEDRLGTAYAAFQKGEWDEALELYKEILVEDPDQVQALKMAGYILYKGLYFDEAEDLFQRALKIEGRTFQSLLMLGNIALIRFKPVKALAYYSRAAELEPNDGVLTENMSQARERIERAVQLKGHYRRASMVFWCVVAAGLTGVLGFVIREIRSALRGEK